MIPTLEITKGLSLSKLLRQQAELYGDKPFLIWRPSSFVRSEISYSSFYNYCLQFASALHKKGVRQYSQVLIHLDNSPETVISWYACALIGAISITTNTKYSSDELKYAISSTEISGIITSERFAKTICDAMSGVYWLIVCPDHEDATDNVARDDENFWMLLQHSAPIIPIVMPGHAPLTVKFTSGTTSRPKPVLWTHSNFFWGALVSSSHQKLSASDRYMIFLPLFHVNAQLWSLAAVLWVGATAVLQRQFSPRSFWNIAIKEGCTCCSMLQFVYQSLIERKRPDNHAFRLWAMGASDLPNDKQFGVRSIGWWGMSETVAQPIVCNLDLARRPDAIGRQSPFYDLSIVDDCGNLVKDGDTGYLYIRGVRGLNLFSCYFGQEQITSESFNGVWFITGDRVTLHPDGYITFAERNSDVLRIRGENVGTSEIERVIKAVAGVQDVAVVGRATAKGDSPVAFVSLKVATLTTEDRELQTAVILRTCRDMLATFKIPDSIIIVERFPRLDMAKIDKAKLKKMLP